jgi:hypothetical protein
MVTFRTIALCLMTCLVPISQELHGGAAPQSGDVFPVVNLPSLTDGTPMSVADFRGRKVLLHQFASW